MRPPQLKRPLRRFTAAAASLACHGLVLLAFLPLSASSPPVPSPLAISVELITLHPPQPRAAAIVAAKSVPPATLSRPVRRSTEADPLPAREDSQASGPGDELTGSQIAGAASADAALADGACDMARQVQGALRNDPLVQAAVAGLGGKVIRVWDGDWVKSQGEDGKGLAAVREAIMWQIAFAPKACRAQAVRGLVLVSTRAGGASPRLAIGMETWRWSDLLTAQRRVSAD